MRKRKRTRRTRRRTGGPTSALSAMEPVGSRYCGKCSFKNTGFLPYCELCEASALRVSWAVRQNPRSSSSSTQRVARTEAPQELRPCPLCSFENPLSRSACGMCSAPLSAAASSSAPQPGQCSEEERRLLTSMGWNPDEEDEEEGGLEAGGSTR